MENIKYYEVEFGNKDNDDCISMCIIGVRKPTITEVEEFYSSDCKMYKEMGYDHIDYIMEISFDEARDGYDMKKDNNLPIFGK